MRQLSRSLGGTVLALGLGAGTARAQAMSVQPAGPPRPVAIAHTATGRPAADSTRRTVPPSAGLGGIAPYYLYAYGYGGGGRFSGGYVPEPPPPAPPDVQGPAPGPASAWVPGHYQWFGSYQWVAGAWAPLPGGAEAWVPGQWVSNAHGWYWSPGYWR
jgi:hypothetical protein